MFQAVFVSDEDISIRPVPCLDQGPQSRQYRRAAGEERDLESELQASRASGQAMTRRKGEITFPMRTKSGIALAERGTSQLPTRSFCA